MTIYGQRWNRAQSAMRAEGIDAVVLAPSADFYYLTGYPAKASERFTGLVLPAAGAPTLILPAFELPRVDPALRGSATCRTWEETEDPLRLTADALDGTHSASPRTVGASNQMWSEFLLGLQERAPRVRWTAASRVIAPLRMEKDDDELRLLEEAQRLAETVLTRLLAAGLAGKTERALADALMSYRREAGLDPAGSAGIVGSGPNGASPHHLNGDRVVQRGDAVVIDFGGGHHGYRADITRTVHIGEPSEEFTGAYAVVLAANAAAFAATRPGATCEQIDRAGRDVIAAAGFGEYFIHRLGHGIGLEGHEPPYMVAGNRLALRRNMTFTDEPGIYLPGRFGVRIEDVVRVTDDGAARLTRFPRDLQIVD